MDNSLRLIFSSLTVISALVFLGSMILIHFLQDKYNPVKNTVSDYAVAPRSKLHSFVAITMTLSGAMASLSLAIAISTSFKTATVYIISLLIISSICRFFLVFFPTDITDQPSTKIGKTHLILAISAFAGIAFAAGHFHITIADEIIGQIVAFTAVLLIFGFLPRLKKIFGLLERIFLFSSIVWLVVLGIELFIR